MLDYTITSYLERLNIVNLILEENKNFNLETLGTYLLNYNEERKKENIIIYNNRELFEKAIRIKHLNDEIKVFVEQKNWKKEKKQKIINSDKKREILKDYWHYILLAESQKNELNYKKITNICKEIIYDMKLIKDQLLGTIYFKNIGEETTEYSMVDIINYKNINHIKACLKLESKDLSTWVGCINYDMNNLISKLKLTDKQKKILKLWRIDGNTLQSIGEKLNITHYSVYDHLQLIFKKIQKKIEHTK